MSRSTGPPDGALIKAVAERCEPEHAKGEKAELHAVEKALIQFIDSLRGKWIEPSHQHFFVWYDMHKAAVEDEETGESGAIAFFDEYLGRGDLSLLGRVLRLRSQERSPRAKRLFPDKPPLAFMVDAVKLIVDEDWLAHPDKAEEYQKRGFHLAPSFAAKMAERYKNGKPHIDAGKSLLRALEQNKVLVKTEKGCAHQQGQNGEKGTPGKANRWKYVDEAAAAPPVDGWGSDDSEPPSPPIEEDDVPF